MSLECIANVAVFPFNSMQDFEIHGRAMQLGWGQESREERPLNTEDSRESTIDQQQHEKVRFLQSHQHRISLYTLLRGQVTKLST